VKNPNQQNIPAGTHPSPNFKKCKDFVDKIPNVLHSAPSSRN